MNSNTHSEPRSLDAWLSYLERIHTQSIDLGLERVRAVGEALGVLKPTPYVILVGGTNGKGSTVAMLNSILSAAGLKTATFTSPHLVDYRERVTVNSHWLSESAHCEAFARVEQARSGTSLTYFEFGTLAALDLIQRAEVDVAILEIGLGGRLDAVNIVDPDLSIVTSVGVDHIAFLGNDRDVIGYEKAGIFRSGKPAICGDPQAPQKLIEHAKRLGAHYLQAGIDFSIVNETASQWSFLGPKGDCIEHLPVPSLPLQNAATVLAALVSSPFDLNLEAIHQGLTTASVPGRFETIRQMPRVILDVGHNPHAAKYLHSQILKLAIPGRVIAVCGMLKDKDIEGTLTELSCVVSDWYFATLPGERGATATQLAQSLPTEGNYRTFESVAIAYKHALRDANDQDVILCFGSFLTITAIYEAEGKVIRG